MSINTLFAGLSACCAAALACIVMARARASAARWSFAAGMLVLAIESSLVTLALRAASSADAMEWQRWRLVALSFAPAAWLWFSSSYARGPAHRRSLRDRLVLIGAALLPPGIFAARDALLEVSATQARLGSAGMVLGAFVLLASVLTLMNLERTFRAAVGTTRWRIKFMLLGVAALLVTRIYTASQELVFRALDVSLDSINSAALLIATPLIVRSLLRTGHFELDVYPSHAVLQNSITVLIAGAYLLLLGLFANTVAAFGGANAFALKALLILIALVGLAIFLQSDRTRLRLRRFVSRHFRRPAYDYRTAWQKFTAATASRLQREELARALVGLVAEVFSALSVSLWLVDEREQSLVLAASTGGNATQADSAAGRASAAPAVLEHLRAHANPTEFENDDAPWAHSLRACHPKIFPHGGDRVCVPLVNRGAVLGVLLLGDRVGGAPFDLQDFEMLKAVGDHAAGSLMNAQLSEQLLHAREFEAFQAMATFFVHDLKNAASTLNLMLQNLPVHFDNPEFRADALRGVGKSVAHINQLISRLSALRHGLKVELAPSDLNTVIDQAVRGLEQTAVPLLRETPPPLPLVPLDSEQLAKVVTNLVLNAIEASPAPGSVRITTAQEDGGVVLSVEDHGRGMSEEFLRSSLFRPFQSTKKNGLGIGLFQSRMIVEAHGGRLTVTSELGQGTTFRVFLPASVPTPTERAPSTPRPVPDDADFYETQAAYRG